MWRGYPARFIRNVTWNKPVPEQFESLPVKEQLQFLESLYPAGFDFAGYQHMLNHPEVLEKEQKQLATLLYSAAQESFKQRQMVEQQPQKKKRVRGK